MYLHLFSLKVFSTIVEEGSFSKAAEKLLITQPAVSLQVKSLENFFSMKLIYRKKREMRLTEAGRLVYGYAKKFEAIYENLIKEASRYKIKEKALSIGATVIPGKYFLPNIICMFGKSHPEITIKLEIDKNRNIMQRLMNMDIDFGVVTNPLDSRKVVCEKFIQYDLALIAPASFPKDKISLKELLNERMIMREEDSGVATCFGRFCLNHGYDMKRFQISAILDCNESVKFAVKEGRGLGIVAKCTILSECSQGSIKIVRLKEGELNHYFYLAYRPEKIEMPVVQELHSFLKQFNLQSI